MNSDGIRSARVSPQTGKRAHVHARTISFVQRSSAIWITGKEPLNAIPMSHWQSQLGPRTFISSQRQDMTMDGDEHISGELVLVEKRNG